MLTESESVTRNCLHYFWTSWYEFILYVEYYD